MKVYLTSRDTDDRLCQKEDIVVEKADNTEINLINIYDDITYQDIEGFGGAFTEAAAVTFNKMSIDNRKEIIAAYFHPKEGIGYNLCRTHINSCDFSLGNYTYVDDKDVKLESFSIKREEQTLILMIREAISMRGDSLKLFASPWSPPSWMKTSERMNNGGSLKPEYKSVWAVYFAKYIKAYANQGIEIWGITVQNEPMAAPPWDSCIYTAEEERDFVRDYLGPTLVKEDLGHIKIIVWDHNKEKVYSRAKTIFSDIEAAKYIWGIGFHWYSGDHFEALSATHEKFKDKKLLFTEGCQEGGVKLGSWATGERYAHDIIGDLNNWSVGFVDWNILLDEKGGPNHVGNFCDAPIICDTVNDKIIYESSFYYIGHFSKFIAHGAKRLGFSKYTDKLEVCAFKNPDGSIAIIVLNRTDEELPFVLNICGSMAKLQSLPHSIMTLLY